MIGDEVVVGEGKYKILGIATGKLRAERHGEPWRDLTGDKLVLTLAQEIRERRATIERLRAPETAVRAAQDLATHLGMSVHEAQEAIGLVREVVDGRAEIKELRERLTYHAKTTAGYNNSIKIAAEEVKRLDTLLAAAENEKTTAVRDLEALRSAVKDLATSLIDWDVMHGHSPTTEEDRIQHGIAADLMKLVGE